MDGFAPADAVTANAAARAGPPLGLLAELTHRCPLQCPYCSNPLNLLKAADELDTRGWLSAFGQAADLGVLQVHLSGGEPTLRADLEDFIAALSARGVYTNLITAGVTLTRERVARLADCGLGHVQLSLQALEAEMSDRIGNYSGSLAKKLEVARWVREAGLPLTLNAPTHRHNIGQAAALIELALELDADRLEIAHVQYYGWAAKNRAALVPDYDAVLEEAAIVGEARERLKGVLNIDYVTPDTYAQFPKPCMGGWAKDVITITPSGKVLPCHAAEILPLPFDTVRDKPLAEIWYDGAAFNRFRGDEWMKEPCGSCPRKAVDFGGCRCQAFALTGDAEATDPACSLSPHHGLMAGFAEASAAAPPPFVYRRIGRN
ncbi:pyrroloquinoline quinone biosynthesis protein PqqE [Rhodomicrobium vannielii ATCC 17100]|uniref:pyrroloquinoline quinone biosynthesis protein PqqE n=1 Tax=Rhodomicrobium vannielii TaxID=1069 RepID=UPI00191B3697|nr:pyrroloquinoline quinone biosynthesis protein PqqE [Rhodomicrobium vannielii]MBJ7533668.1 pyrroloquinoline quinone biosynthesis protein PqqE [Rhodomicrobium vannielii ATCC 17100]